MIFKRLTGMVFYNNLFFLFRHPTVLPSDMIKQIDQMFDTNTSDEFDLDFVPNLVFNDCEEWEKLPNSTFKSFQNT